MNSKSEMASSHPAYAQMSPVDYSVTVHAYYSSVCHTMWATSPRAAGASDTCCRCYLSPAVQAHYDYTDRCPAKGNSLTTPMMNDANGRQYRRRHRGRLAAVCR